VKGDDQADSRLFNPLPAPFRLPNDSGSAFSGAMAAAHGISGHQTDSDHGRNEPHRH
jgi:hypothetical protein